MFWFHPSEPNQSFELGCPVSLFPWKAELELQLDAQMWASCEWILKMVSSENLYIYECVFQHHQPSSIPIWIEWVMAKVWDWLGDGILHFRRILN